MATFTKRVGRHGAVSWRALVRRKGVVACNTFPTKLQAQEWAAQVESDAVKGEYRGQSKSTLGAVIGRFADSVSPNRRGSRWEMVRLAAFQEREKRLCALPLSSVDVGALEQWRDIRLSSVSPSTVRREIALLGAVFSQAVRWGLIRHNPLKDVVKPVAPAARRRGINNHEVKAICQALGVDGRGGEIAAAFLLSLETGMRAGEILGLTWGHVHLDERYVVLPKTKNGDSRQVPLSRAAVDILRERVDYANSSERADDARVFTITGPTLDVLFRRARARAAVDCPSCVDIHFHDARGQAIRNFVAKRLSAPEICSIVGHRDLKSIMFYFKHSAAEIAKKLD